VEDRAFLYALNEATMRLHAERIWGWDDAEQQDFFDRRFDPERWQVIQVDGRDAGVLIVDESPVEVYLAEIQLLPECQGRGVGTAIVRSLQSRAERSGKPVTLRVLHLNERARALYERLGFRATHEIKTHAYLRWDPEGVLPSS
jgi:ribosomal protein S18 acetylase RimI-like enzyme